MKLNTFENTRTTNIGLENEGKHLTSIICAWFLNCNCFEFLYQIRQIATETVMSYVMKTF